MNSKEVICICGGGNVSHVLAAVLGRKTNVEVRVLTRRPDKWRSSVKIYYDSQFELTGKIKSVSSQPHEVIPNSSIVLFALPAFALQEVYNSIKPYLQNEMLLGAIPGTGGFEWITADLHKKGITVFGMQRSPYNCRIKKYGSTVEVYGVRDNSLISVMPDKNKSMVAEKISALLDLPIAILPNYLNVTLCPGNSVFHSSRLYSLYNNWQEDKPHQKKFGFYSEWDDHSSRIYLDCDREIQNICNEIPLDLSGVLSIKKHYSVNEVNELSNVIRNINSLKKIEAPLLKTKNGFMPDHHHRFFTEDLNINLSIIKKIAAIAKVKTPMIDELSKWNDEMIEKKYYNDKRELIAESFSLSEIKDLKSLTAFYKK